MRLLLLSIVAFALLLTGCTQSAGPDNGAINQTHNFAAGGPSSYNAPSADSSASPYSTPVNPSAANLALYSMSTVSMHNTPSDCWVAINGSVYNFSNNPMVNRSRSFGNDSSGNSGSFTSICGTDASSAFGARGMRGNSTGFNNSGSRNFTRNSTRGNFTPPSGGFANRSAGNASPFGAGGLQSLIIGKLE